LKYIGNAHHSDWSDRRHELACYIFIPIDLNDWLPPIYRKRTMIEVGFDFDFSNICSLSWVQMEIY